MAQKVAVALNTSLNLAAQLFNCVNMLKTNQSRLREICDNFDNMNDGTDFTMVATALGIGTPVSPALVTVAKNALAAMDNSVDFNLLCDALISSQ